jgi:hypothetical protein
MGRNLTIYCHIPRLDVLGGLERLARDGVAGTGIEGSIALARWWNHTAAEFGLGMTVTRAGVSHRKSVVVEQRNSRSIISKETLKLGTQMMCIGYMC